MQMELIQRQYDEVISHHYDRDPQDVTQRVLHHALGQILSAPHGAAATFPEQPPTAERPNVLDLGIGTGLFLEMLMHSPFGPVSAYGIDLSARMAEIAKVRVPGLECAVDDAANFDSHFAEQQFDVICTHLVTGFVSIKHLAPLIAKRLKPGGLWSFAGSTSSAYPELSRRSESALVRFLMSGRTAGQRENICPADMAAVESAFAHVGLTTLHSELFRPELHFQTFAEFMEYAYEGGWLTPFVEDLGLHRAGRSVRMLLDRLVFPVIDHHEIVIALGRKAY